MVQKYIASFWVSNGLTRIKESENSPAILVSHINNFIKRFNIDVLSRDGNEEEL